jgi:enoyl-CoA hydratase
MGQAQRSFAQGGALTLPRPPAKRRGMSDPLTALPEIICERRGAAGFVTLNRPKALNALTHGMVTELAAALDRWEHDPAIGRIIITGTGEKAFCAGGDIRQLYELGREGRLDEARTFWADEYRLNLRIKTYPKPYIALIDGIVMGGGVGVSQPGHYRVAGDRYLFAMPEVGIGFFPDVGATHFLPRLPDATGIWLGLTGERIGAGDALATGLATHAVPSAAMSALAELLCDGAIAVDEALARHAHRPDAIKLKADRTVIGDCFGAGDLAAILAALQSHADGGSDFAKRTLATLRTKSPTSIAIAARQMQSGATLDFAEAMRTEYRIVSRIAEGHDFYEGVRALIVDKDNQPHWRPSRIEDVNATQIDAYFAPLGAHELRL